MQDQIRDQSHKVNKNRQSVDFHVDQATEKRILDDLISHLSDGLYDLPKHLDLFKQANRSNQIDFFKFLEEKLEKIIRTKTETKDLAIRANAYEALGQIAAQQKDLDKLMVVKQRFKSDNCFYRLQEQVKMPLPRLGNPTVRLSEWCENNRKYEKVEISLAMAQGDLHSAKKDFAQAIRLYLDAYKIASHVVKRDTFVSSYEDSASTAAKKIAKCIKTLIKTNPAAAVYWNNEARKSGLLTVFNDSEINVLKHYESFERKNTQYTNALPAKLDSFYAPSLINRSMEKGKEVSFYPVYQLASFFGNSKSTADFMTLLLLPVIACGIVVIGLGHGLFTACSRKPLSTENILKLPEYLNTFANFDVTWKTTLIEKIAAKYQPHDVSEPESKSSKELLNLLRNSTVHIEHKWAAIDAYMLEPFNRNTDHSLLKNNGKLMFKAIFDELEGMHRQFSNSVTSFNTTTLATAPALQPVYK